MRLHLNQTQVAFIRSSDIPVPHSSQISAFQKYAASPRLALGESRCIADPNILGIWTAFLLQMGMLAQELSSGTVFCREAIEKRFIYANNIARYEPGKISGHQRKMRKPPREGNLIKYNVFKEEQRVNMEDGRCGEGGEGREGQSLGCYFCCSTR